MDFRSYPHCELCGKPLPKNEIAASFTTDVRPGELVWCFDCWDYDERAVEQYRDVGNSQAVKDAMAGGLNAQVAYVLDLDKAEIDRIAPPPTTHLKGNESK